MSSGAGASCVEVCFVDPRVILRPEALKDLLADARRVAHLSVPRDFLPLLSQGVMELGDSDDPMNAWYFGRRDELFKYRMVGSHASMSGFTAIMEREQLVAICNGEGTVGLPSWEDFVADLREGQLGFPSLRAEPFLFAGTVLDAPAAAVYALKEGGRVVGVAVSSEAGFD